MDIIQLLQKELAAEAITTRKMLQRVPAEKFDWQPHPKSMTMKQLSTHIAELPSWVTMALTTSELDFANSPYEPAEVKDNAALLALFDKSLEQGKGSLSTAKEEDLLPMWSLRNGDQVYMTMSKYDVIRHAFSQTIHHRGTIRGISAVAGYSHSWQLWPKCRRTILGGKWETIDSRK